MISLLPRSHQFLRRLRVSASRGETLRAERMIATARAFLAISSFLAIYVDPTEPARYARLAYASLLLYAIHSLIILLVLRMQLETTPRFSFALHSVDVLWPAYITLFTEGPNSPFFAFFVFVLLAAAYRWGLPETLMTSAVAVATMVLETFLLVAGPWTIEPFVEGEFDVNRLIIRSAYLLIIAFLAGYLAEGEKRLRSEAYVIARVMGKARVEIGLRGTLQAVLDEFLQLFDTRLALLVFEEANTGNVFVWKAERHAESGQTVLSLSEMEREQRNTYFFPFPGDAAYAIRRNPAEDNSSCGLLALDREDERLRAATLNLPASFLEKHPFSRTLLFVSFQIRQEWLGRLFLLDPAWGSPRKVELQFARTLMTRILPAIYNVYLLRRLRSQVSQTERSRFARELHDGVMQSLSVAVMHMGLLRLEKFRASANLDEELARIQEMLRKELVNLRELMEQMRPLVLKPNQLLDFLSDLVEKFRRDTGINARFLSGLEAVTLPANVCREMVRIVQEALFNVRRHSEAQNVVVSLSSQNGQWKLTIDDDGRGFPFEGRFSQAELDETRRGPVVIKERVRSLGGELTVDSVPGRGACLEIIIPEQTTTDKEYD